MFLRRIFHSATATTAIDDVDAVHERRRPVPRSVPGHNNMVLLLLLLLLLLLVRWTGTTNAYTTTPLLSLSSSLSSSSSSLLLVLQQHQHQQQHQQQQQRFSPKGRFIPRSTAHHNHHHCGICRQYHHYHHDSCATTLHSVMDAELVLDPDHCHSTDDSSNDDSNDTGSIIIYESSRSSIHDNSSRQQHQRHHQQQQHGNRVSHIWRSLQRRTESLLLRRRGRFGVTKRLSTFLRTAAVALTMVLCHISSSSSPLLSTTTSTTVATASTSGSTNTAPVTIVPTASHHVQQSRQVTLLASSGSHVSPLHHATMLHVQRGGTTTPATTTTTTPPAKVVKKPQSQHRHGHSKKQQQQQQHQDSSTTIVNEIRNMERVVEQSVVVAGEQTSRTLVEALHDLHQYMRGPKSDTLLLLLATALITPLCQQVNLSPILGFLAAGMFMGPNGFGVISGIHTTETLAELGIVFFLFEMGIELSFNRLKSMRRDVFGLGLAQFMTTALAVAGIGAVVGLPANANVVLGGGLALSSSAFVLQLLKDKNQLATRFGKAAFGVLLFQDLAVVPLLVVTPILAGSGAGLATALSSALVKAAMALSSIAVAGRYVLNPLFKTVAQAQSQEAFLGVVLLTVLSMSFMTEGLGLSNTLGAFLAGVLLSETKYRYQVEADIAPFRGILLGLFFVTVGFEIDVKLIASNLPLVGSLVFGIMGIKAAITTALSLAFGLSLSTSQQTGLMLSQGGEFAFVAFGLARSLGILDKPTTKLMLTSVSLTMALTPLMSTLGSKIAKQLEEQSDATHYLGQDRDANEIKESDDFTVVIGYGIVGKVVCDLLDRKFLRYVGLEIDPNRAIQARNAGLPVFYGDIGRQEVAEAFNVGKANAVVVCIADKAQTNRVVIALRRWYPELPIFARAVNADHAKRLQDTLNVAAMVPILPMDNILLTLPFGSAVMKSIGVPPEEVNAIVDAKRREIINIRGSDREEEELELLQLGISSDTLKDTSGFTDSNDDDTLDEEERYDEQYEMTTEAAWERRKAIEEKSPFVARVIQEVCPESADDEDDEDVIDVTDGANGANGETNASISLTEVEFSLVNNNNRTIAVTAEQN